MELTAQREEVKEKIDSMLLEIEKVIVGQKELIESILVGLFSNGHILIEGYPGLGKTITVKTFARVLNAKFHRVQFTPDLIPGDITGFEMYDAETLKCTVQKGPVFTNILLADEINRAPAKVQSALLEAMQERQVTIGKASYPLEKLFLVLATQNPIEIAGTYLLPEAEIDRFMLKLNISYPSYAEEREITERQVKDEDVKLKPVFSPDDLISLRHLIAQQNPLYESSPIVRYATRIVRATRPEETDEKGIKELVMYGASPRASIALAKAARVYAFLRGDGIILPEHIHRMAYPVLRHRIILSHEAESLGVTPDDIIATILQKVPRLEWNGAV